MVLILKKFLVMLTVVAFFLPAVLAIDCGEDHQDECTELCVCICHEAISQTKPEVVFCMIDFESSYNRPTDDIFRGKMLLADVFRPPICA